MVAARSGQRRNTRRIQFGARTGPSLLFTWRLGGAAAGYREHSPEILRSLKNGFDAQKNLEIATEHRVDALVDQVVSQLCHLPLVRGEAKSGGTFRILALDGGGIKGTFTAAVLGEWEALTKINNRGAW